MKKQAENDNANSENLPVNDKIGVKIGAKIRAKIGVNDNVNDNVKDNVNDKIGAKDNVNDNVNDKIGVKIVVNDNAKITPKITVNQEKILDEIKKNPYITQKELSDLIKMTIPNINRNMKKLQEQGIIRRVGADKNGHWEIINE